MTEKLSTVEKMIQAVFRAMDFDVEQVKSDVLNRVAAFEKNIEVLNATLIAHQQSLDRIEIALGIVKPAANQLENTENERPDTEPGTVAHEVTH